MENYAAYQTYPDSGESSPRSREIDFENPQPWDDPNYKVKFMCSYGGKIQPRTHDNQLSYVGGETKILAVDRNIKFTTMISKLSALYNAEVSFKYQLPGEDLDALISVTNDDDLDHMMHEYDRLFRASSRPARMRLFLFTVDQVKPSSTNNVDFLFDLEKPVVVPPPQPPPAAVKFHDPVPEPVAPPTPPPAHRVVGSDPNLNHPLEIQRELQRMQIAENEQAAYRRKSEENLVGNYPAGGDYYVQKVPEKFAPSNFPASAPSPPPQQQHQHQAGYWQEKPVSGEVYPPTMSGVHGGGDQPVYVIQAPGTFYHAPVVRPPPATQGYYTVQRMPSDAYRDPPVYGGVPPPNTQFSSAVPVTVAPAQPVKAPAYTEGINVVRQAGIPDNTGAAYAQVAYDSASGRQVYYNAPGGVVHAQPYQGVAAPVTTDMRTATSKISQGSV